MNQDNHFSPFIPFEKTDALAIMSKKPNKLFSTKKWSFPFLFLGLNYIAIQTCYFIARGQNNSVLLGLTEFAVIIVSLIFVYSLIKIKKESNARNKELAQLKDLLQKKNRSLEDLVLLSELQQSKLISTTLLKEKLTSVVSHDMRVPLNVFKKLKSDYEKGLISSRIFTIGIIETKNELSKINEMALSMLSFSEKEDGGSYQQKISPEEITETLDSALLLFKQYAKNKKIDIIPYVQLPANMCLCIAAIELEIIIRSLISNAIKFSNSDSVIIITLKADAGASGSVATLSVKDFGKGMRPSTLSLINGTKAISGITTLDEGSLGIGLHIVFDMINNNNLQYNIESDVEKGTKFSINIPLVTQ